MRQHSAIAITFGVILLCAPLLSDTILLRNGRTVEGVVQRQDRTRIWVRSGGRLIEIQKSDVRRVLYGDEAAKAAEEKRKREAEERRRREEAQRREDEKRAEATKKAEISRKAEAVRQAEEHRRAAEEARLREALFAKRHELTVGIGFARGSLRSMHTEGISSFDEKRTILGSPFLTRYSDERDASGGLLTLGYRYRRFLVEAEALRWDRDPSFLGFERDPPGNNSTATTLRLGDRRRARRDQGSILGGWTVGRWDGLELGALAGGRAFYQRDTFTAFGVRRSVNLADGAASNVAIFDPEDSVRGRLYGPEAGLRLSYTLWDRLDLSLRFSSHRLHGELIFTQSTVLLAPLPAGLFVRQSTLRVSAPMRVRGQAGVLSVGYRLPMGLSLFLEARGSNSTAEFRRSTLSFPISGEVGPGQLFLTDLVLKNLIVGEQVKDRERGLAMGLRKTFDFSR